MRETRAGERWIEDPTAHDYARACEAALARRSHREALELGVAAYCLSSDPAHLRLVDRAIDEAPRPLVTLKPVRDAEVFYGALAGYARALARHRRFAEAAELLVEAVSAQPDTPLFAWCEAWPMRKRDAEKVRAEPFAARLLDFEAAARRRTNDASVAKNLARAARLAGRVAAQRPDAPALAILGSRLLRAAGHLDDAERALAPLTSGSWVEAVERAAVAAARGDYEGRVTWLSRAVEASPTNASTWTDLAEAQLAAGSLEHAVRAFERALEVSPASAPARAGLAYALSLAAAAPFEEESTTEPAHTGGLAAEEKTAIDSYFLDLAAYVQTLVDPLDPVVGVLRAFAEREIRGEPRTVKVRVRADFPVGPTARRAFDAVRRRKAVSAELDVACEHGPVDFGPLFGDRGAPVVEPPGEPARALVEAIVATPFEWRAWTELARTAGSRSSHELAAAIAHPFVPGHEADVPGAIHARQIAAALLAAFAPDRDLDLLRACARARGDWCSIAALLALRAVADHDPAFEAGLFDLARSLVPAPSEPLPPFARALCRVGPPAEPAFVRLRARVRAATRDKPG